LGGCRGVRTPDKGRFFSSTGHKPNAYVGLKVKGSGGAWEKRSRGEIATPDLFTRSFLLMGSTHSNRRVF